MTGRLKVGMSTLIAIAMGISFVVVGCGSSPASSDSDDVAEVVDRYFRAYNEGNGDEACSLLSDGAQEATIDLYQSIGASYDDCETAINEEQRNNAIDPSLVATASNVNVDGDRATAEVGPTRNTVALEKLDSGWQIQRLP